MRKIVMVLGALLFLTNSAAAQMKGFIQHKTVVTEPAQIQVIESTLSQRVCGVIGMNAWIQASRTGGQFRVGPSLMPVSWLQVDSGLGLEQGYDGYRYGGGVKLTPGPLFLLLKAERGKSDFFLAETHVRLNQFIRLGWWHDNVRDGGPQVILSYPGIPLTVWGVRQEDATVLSMRYSF
jgi:hypothetical protein